jgi:hypothetical protein
MPGVLDDGQSDLGRFMTEQTHDPVFARMYNLRAAWSDFHAALVTHAHANFTPRQMVERMGWVQPGAKDRRYDRALAKLVDFEKGRTEPGLWQVIYYLVAAGVDPAIFLALAHRPRAYTARIQPDVEPVFECARVTSNVEAYFVLNLRDHRRALEASEGLTTSKLAERMFELFPSGALRRPNSKMIERFESGSADPRFRWVLYLASAMGLDVVQWLNSMTATLTAQTTN